MPDERPSPDEVEVDAVVCDDDLSPDVLDEAADVSDADAEPEELDDDLVADDGYDEDALEDDEETDFATVATGPDVATARRTALEQLRKIVPWVTESDVEFEVVDEGSRGGLFGRGRVRAEVEARVLPRAPEDEEPAPAEPPSEVVGEVHSFLADLVDLMGLEAEIDVHEDGDGVVADLDGPDLGILIGRHGQTIDALQYVSAIAVNRRHKSRRRIVVDAQGYRDRRAASLHSMADRVAQQVARDGEPVTLKPMTAAERKVIHLHLKEHPRVETISDGQEPNRAVTIAPRHPS